METIINYIDNLFNTMPRTNDIARLRSELLANMEDKYLALKQEGKTENEAVGIVIAEFGSIDELAREMNIDINAKQEDAVLHIDMNQAIRFIDATKLAAPMASLGIMLIILGTAVLIFFVSLTTLPFIGGIIGEDIPAVTGLIAMMLMIAVGVGMIILSRSRLEPFDYLMGGFSLPSSVRNYVLTEKTAFAGKKNSIRLISIMMYILSPVFLFVLVLFGETAAMLGVVVLLAIVALATGMIVYVSRIDAGYDVLLKMIR